VGLENSNTSSSSSKLPRDGDARRLFFAELETYPPTSLPGALVL